jgi:hypothetical protein
MEVILLCRSQWPRGLRRGSAAARLLGLWVRIPPRAWMSVCCECCVLSGRGLCDGLITRPEEPYRLWCVWCVIVKPRKWGGPGPLGVVVPLKKKAVMFLKTFNEIFTCKSSPLNTSLFAASVYFYPWLKSVLTKVAEGNTGVSTGVV